MEAAGEVPTHGLRELLSSAKRLIRDRDGAERVEEGRASEVFLDGLSRSMSFTVVERAASIISREGLRGSIQELIRTLLEQRLEGVLDAAAVNRESYSTRTELLRRMWFLYPYIFYFLAHLLKLFETAVERLSGAYLRFKDQFRANRADATDGGSIEVRLLASDFHPMDFPGFEVTASPERSYIFKHRHDDALDLLVGLYGRCLKSAPALFGHDAFRAARLEVARCNGFSITRKIRQYAAFTESELQRYYAAAGALAACATALDVTDLHYENVIASTVPMPIDVESIFYWSASGVPQSERGGVLASGLLPFSIRGNGEVRFDLSALGCIQEHRTPFPSRWNRKSGQSLSTVAKPTANRTLRLNGSAIGPSRYEAVLIQGFERALDYLGQHYRIEANGIAERLDRGLSCRVFNEPSVIYDEYISVLSEPLLLSNFPALRMSAAYLLNRPGRLARQSSREIEELLLLGIPRTMVEVGKTADSGEHRIIEEFCKTCRGFAGSEMARQVAVAMVKRSLRQAMFC